MFFYQVGPLKVKITLENSLSKLEEELKEYYRHALIDDNKFDHHCHIASWSEGQYKSPNKDIIKWENRKVEVSSERNIKIDCMWDKNLNSIINVYEGFDHLFDHDRKKYWEFSQRISLYPVLAKKRGFMIHCAAIIVNNKAHIFMGPSGAGKSTTAHKAIMGGYKVLTDDTAIITKENDKLMTYSSPYTSKSGLIGERGKYEIDKFYILSQSNEDTLAEVDKGTFIKCLQERIYESQYWSHIFHFNSNSLSGEIGNHLLKNAFYIVKKYKAYEYRFTLKSSINNIFQ
ncbi:hypothetical protein H1Z61_04250 [Bacillus aquiflavi]|uniref:Aldolase n=1 Tax=Bacillus aquiflavi TaxID=2672567 RepID=A0A6B3VYQ6_9BACI|nr:hypothetical protein [Bacillus aquiflavi]MBA4536373.1 hypothetical protein [Bacillus aquiflavi]NEY80741.1 hypothetical protein [Bacillus aquiflavi]UAC48066.1 hypothetical protein K6959_16010 [Bacillus aquiflavi]